MVQVFRGVAIINHMQNEPMKQEVSKKDIQDLETIRRDLEWVFKRDTCKTFFNLKKMYSSCATYIEKYI